MTNLHGATTPSHQAIGLHVVADFWLCQQSVDIASVESIMKKAANAAGATVLNCQIHDFTGGGVTGVVLLAESHMSIHTWPEHNYIAIDIFMCGQSNIDKALKTLENYFSPKKKEIKMIKRGRPYLGEY